MSDDEAIRACRAFVRHVILRMQESEDVAYYFGFATRSRELLVDAAVLLFGESREDLEEKINNIAPKRCPSPQLASEWRDVVRAARRYVQEESAAGTGPEHRLLLEAVRCCRFDEDGNELAQPGGAR